VGELPFEEDASFTQVGLGGVQLAVLAPGNNGLDDRSSFVGEDVCVDEEGLQEIPPSSFTPKRLVLFAGLA
jgi:hypothetical protein